MTSLFKYTIPQTGRYSIYHPILFNGTYYYEQGDVVEIIEENNHGHTMEKYVLKRNSMLMSNCSIMGHDGMYSTKLYKLFAMDMNKLIIRRIQ